ncbi:MAG: hypothetical protein ACKOGD_11760 [Sphingomonadales bacterium]
MSQKIKWIEDQQLHAFCALSSIPVITEDKDSSELVSSSLSSIKKQVVECSTTGKTDRDKEEHENTVDKSSSPASKSTETE